MEKNFIPSLFHFPKYWYLDVPAWWLRFLRRVLTFFDNQLATRVMIKFWLVPVWQDTTVIGRSLSFIFRSVRIVLGLTVEALVLLVLLSGICLWLSLPVLILLTYPLVLGLIPFIWIIDACFDYVAKVRNPFSLIINQAQGDIDRLQSLILDNPQTAELLIHIEQQALPEKKLDLDVTQLVEKAEAEKQELNDSELKVEHLFLAILKQLKFHHQEAVGAYIWLKQKKKWSKRPFIWQDDYPILPTGGVNRAWTGIITPELDRISTDLTRLAAAGKLPEMIGREKMVQEIVEALGKESRDNALIIGEAGSGKTTLVEGFANQIIRGTSFQSLQFKRLVSLDISGLTAGSPAAVKERLVTVIREIKEAGNVILFIDELHNLVAAEENQNSSIVFTALEPHLDAGEFQFLATTTPNNFKRYIEASDAFVRTFRTINLQPASQEETLKIGELKAYELEKSHKLTFTYIALLSAVELGRRYVQNRVLPDSAINLLEEVANKHKTAVNFLITSKEIEAMVTDLTQIPVRTADSQEEKKILLEMEQTLHQRVVGQEKAIEEIADALRRARTGMSEEGKLIASFLFAGPTGVGKTETAKALAEVYFGSEKSMVRVDMSEYQSSDSINRLIGPPPGKPGYEMGGHLTEAIRRKPFTVVLLDEIEKADKRILDVFLQLLDDARLTDGSGRTIDFSNTMIIATSNVGTKALLQGAEQGKPFTELIGKVESQLKDFFRPEFLNRFSDIIIYRPLTKTQVEAITGILLTKLNKTLSEKEFKLEFTPELITGLAEKGYNPMWGARELKRVIRDEVEEKIAKKILQGEIKPGEIYTVSPAIFDQ